MPEASLESKQKQASPWTAGVAHDASQQVATWPEPAGDSRALGPRQSPLLSLQRAMGNQAVARMLQTKLTVSEPGDIYEQEADRLADQVMRMPDPAPPSSPSGTEMLQRKCESCSEEDEKKKEEESHQKVSRKELSRAPLEGTTAPPIVHTVIGSTGQPLDLATRAFMEPRFGRDFSQVRVHTDATAVESARALGAHAYTVGSNIVFGQGKLAPASSSGRRLIAHELAHVIQQNDLPGLVPAGRMAIQREEDEGSPTGDTGAAPASVISSQVKDFSRLKPGFEIDEAAGRAFALTAIATMSPFGAKVSSPPSDAIASVDPDTTGAVATNDIETGEGTVQTSAIQPIVQRSGGSSVKPEAGFVGSLQLCYDACNGELSVVGWIWAGGGVVTPGLLGGHGWWGAYIFAEREFFKTTLNFMPTLNCGTCRKDCKPDEAPTSWGGGIAGFPLVLTPGQRASLKQAGIEVGALLSPHSLCDADLEIIALVDLTKYLGPLGAAVVAAEELANKLGKKFGIEISCGVGIDISGTLHLCKSVPGGGLLGITSDSAKICGGGYAGCGIGLEHDKSALPGI